MFLRILLASFVRRWKRKLLAVSSITLGIALIAAFLTMALDVRDRVARELAQFGANFEVRPRAVTAVQSLTGAAHVDNAGALLVEGDLSRLATFFWSLNVLGYAPFHSTSVHVAPSDAVVTLTGTWFDRPAPAQGGAADTVGVVPLHPWWTIAGQWPSDDAAQRECALGRRLAEKLRVRAGDDVHVRGISGEVTLRVTGVCATGTAEDEAILAPLAIAQSLARTPGRYDRLLLSALTRPETQLAQKDPITLTPMEYEILECTNFPSTIARSLTRTLTNADAHPVREVSDTQGVILERLRGILTALSVAAGVAAALGVLGAMAAAVLERRAEVGLLKTLGASPFSILALFVGEAGLLGLSGGLAGYGLGVVSAWVIGHRLLGSALHVSPVVLPLCLALAFAVSVGGSILPIRRAMRVDPVRVLHGA